MHDHWLERWQVGNINFHRSDVHPALRRHWLPRHGTVLVPLCGKSLDLRWLAERGHRVIGVELAERAIRDFFAEQQLSHERCELGGLPAFVAAELPLTLLHGDYFAVRDLACDALYDRAAMVALPPELRRRYAAQTDSLLVVDAFRLLVTLEYDQSLVAGPPFSVPSSEVLDCWPQLAQLERMADPEQTPPKFRSAGVVVTETVWRSVAGS